MRLITEPSVYLVGRQAVDEAELSRFLSANDVSHWTTDTDIPAEKLTEAAGRLCYLSFAKPRPGGNKAYTEHILAVGHGSVTEHAVFSFIIEGVSRSLTHELVRHRAGFGFSQLSQRYVDESDTAFVVPPALQKAVEAGLFLREYTNNDKTVGEVMNDGKERFGGGFVGLIECGLHWLQSVEKSLAMYVGLSDGLASQFSHISDATARRKLAREAARSVLPNCTETKIFVTGNARALRHFLEMRGSVHADAEIRRLALAMLKLLQAEAPNLFGDYRVLKAEDGRDYIHTDYHKV